MSSTCGRILGKPNGGYSTSGAYTLRRLADERPDLYERVVAGEMSAEVPGVMVLG